MTLSEVASILAVLVSAYAIFAQRRKVNAEANVTNSQREVLENDITEKVLQRANAEIEKNQRKIVSLEAQLEASNKLIGALMEKDRERESAMNALKAEFDRDTALRVNIDKMLAVANQRITALETERTELYQRISALEDELDKRDARIKELESNQRQVGSGGLLSR